MVYLCEVAGTERYWYPRDADKQHWERTKEQKRPGDHVNFCWRKKRHDYKELLMVCDVISLYGFEMSSLGFVKVLFEFGFIYQMSKMGWDQWWSHLMWTSHAEFVSCQLKPSCWRRGEGWEVMEALGPLKDRWLWTTGTRLLSSCKFIHCCTRICKTEL